MKKIIIALSVLAASTLGLSAQNQTQNNKTAGQPNKEMAKKHVDGKKQKGANPFDGLNLTEQQRKQLTDLRTQSKAKKAANDSTQRARRAEHAAKAKTMRADYLKSVKAILTPDQYVKFLENNYVNAGKGHKKGYGGKAFAKDGRKHKGHAKGKNKEMSRTKKDNSKKKS